MSAYLLTVYDKLSITGELVLIGILYVSIKYNFKIAKAKRQTNPCYQIYQLYQIVNYAT